jgi:putative ABC transport system permease protein
MLLSSRGTISSMALRNLNRQKKRSVLLGAAIAFGIMIIMIINGFSGAFMQNVSENFANLAAGHIFIQGNERNESGKTVSVIRDDAIVMQVIKETGIPARYVTKRSLAQGTIIFEGRKTVAQVQGVDFSNETFLADRLALSQGSFKGISNRQGLILSDQTARKLNVQIGDQLLMQLTTVTGQQNVGDMVLVATTPDNGMMSGFSAYANLSYVNELLDLGPGEYQVLGVYLPSLEGMDRYANALYADLKTRANVKERTSGMASAMSGMGAMGDMAASLFGGGTPEAPWTGVRYTVTTLDDLLSPVKQIVNVLNAVSLAVLVVLFLIIMVGILNTFRMTMFERIREIGTMRAIGMQRSQVRNLFLLEALFLALAGMVVGIALAALIMAALSLFNLGVDSPLFMILRNGHLSFTVPLARGVENVFIIALLTLGAADLPARAAARLEPARALRTTK